MEIPRNIFSKILSIIYLGLATLAQNDPVLLVDSSSTGCWQ